jgi:uncharacterized protein
MKKVLLCLPLFLGVGLIACTNESNTNRQSQGVNDNAIKNTDTMKNIVSIVEISTNDFSRAVKFYKAILNVSIEEVDMGGVQMGLLPGSGETVNVALVKGSDYKPTTEGTVVYLNAGKDLQPTLDKIEQNGGKIIVPKTEISPEMGFYALFIDTEGNKLGLHSTN